MKKMLVFVTLLAGCSQEIERNRAVEAAKFIMPDVVCQVSSSTPASDSAWCRTPAKDVFFCTQGIDEMFKCVQFGVKPPEPSKAAVENLIEGNKTP